MIADRCRNWLSMKFLALGNFCLDIAVWVEPPRTMPPRKGPPLELDREGDGGDEPQQMEFAV